MISQFLAYGIMAFLAHIALAPAWLAWTTTHLGGGWVSAHSSSVLACMLGAAVCMLTFIPVRVTRRLASGLWITPPGRWIIGRLAGAAVILGLTGLFLASFLWIVTGWCAIAPSVCLAFVFSKRAKITIGKTTRPYRRLMRAHAIGLGGSAAFAGLLEEWANPWKPGLIMLGSSMYDRRWLVGTPDDRHFATIATNRAGKGLGIISNLIVWPGSALVIDIKGQNAAVTAAARGTGRKHSLGQAVHIVDPFGNGSARLNPLAEFDPSAADYVERVDAISNALVIPGTGKNDSFFDNSSRAIISGAIDYVVRSPTIPVDQKHLGKVREILVGALPGAEMIKLGGLARAAAAQIAKGSTNSSGDVQSTALAHTKWLDSPVMCNVLSESTFSLKELNNGNTTVYLVLPPEYLSEHKRFLRLFVALALKAVAAGKKGKYPTLFILDEFYSLGALQDLSDASGLLAGYGIKLWPIVHNVSQMKHLYPQNWETFLGNAGQCQVFAMNDKTTCDYVSDRLGMRVHWRETNSAGGTEWEPVRATSLRDGVELGRTSGRQSSACIVLNEGSDPFLLRRAVYTKLFSKDRYDPDPYEPQGSSLLKRLRTDAVKFVERVRAYVPPVTSAVMRTWSWSRGRLSNRRPGQKGH